MSDDRSADAGDLPPPEEFEAAADRAFESIPMEFRKGIEGLRIRRSAMPHPTLRDVYTLGECRALDWASPIDSIAEIRSEVILYYGSFRRLAALDPEFDWQAELWETVSHEVQHHLEFRAEVVTLEERDYADDHSFRRAAGEPFDPFFYRAGEPIAPGVWQVADDWYVEGRVPDPTGREVVFGWRGERCRVVLDGPLGRVTFVGIDGIETGPGAVWVVVSVGGWRSWLRRLLGREPSRPAVAEYEATAECGFADER